MFSSIIYISFFAILIIGSSSVKENTSFTRFIAILFLLIIGLRHISVGPDTWSYCEDFKTFSLYDSSNIGLLLQGHSEPLYVLISWLIGRVTTSYTIFLMIWASFIVCPILWAQKSYLNQPSDIVVSYIVIFILSLGAFFMAGIRQTAAIGIVLYSYQYLKVPFSKNKLIDSATLKFFLLMVIGYCIHNSIIVFAMIYPLKGFLQNFRFKGWHIVLIIILAYFGSRVSDSQINGLTHLFFEERFNQYGDTVKTEVNSTGFIIQGFLFVTCYIVRDVLQTKDESNTLLLNLVGLGFLFQSMTGAIGEMFRVSYYFSVFYIILFPKGISEISSSNKGRFYFYFIAISFSYLFFISSASLPQYKFFWQ